MARRLRTNKLGVEAAQVNLKINAETKAVQGLSKGENELTQVAHALAQINPKINKFLMNQHDRINEEYHADALEQTRKRKMDPQTKRLIGEIVSDNKNPSYLKSVAYWEAMKVVRYARADASQRYAGFSTNEAGDNAFRFDRDDPDSIIAQIAKEYIPEGASRTFANTFNEEMAKTHQQGHEFFVQKAFAQHSVQKDDMGFNTVRHQVIDPDTNEFLGGVEAAENILKGKAQMLKDGFSKEDWWKHTTSVLSLQTEQGKRDIVTALAGMESREGFTYATDPKYLGDIKKLMKYAKIRKEKLATFDEHVTSEQTKVDEVVGDTTLTDVQEKFDDGEYEDLDEAKEAASRVITKTARKNASAAAQNLKDIREDKDEAYKDGFIADVAEALLNQQPNRQSTFLYDQPAGTKKMQRKNPQTFKEVIFDVKDTKRKALNHAINTIRKEASETSTQGMSPQQIEEYRSGINSEMLDVVHASGETFGGWKVGFNLLAKDVSKADLQQSSITPQMYDRIKTALFIRRENNEIFNEHVSSAGLKNFLEHLQGRINDTGVVASDSEGFTSLIFETKEQLRLMDEATRGAVDMQSKTVKALKEDFDDLGWSPAMANQAINEGSRNYAGNPNLSDENKASRILETAREKTHKLNNGSIIFKTKADDHTFRQAFKKRNESQSAAITLNDAVELFPEAIRNMRPDLYGEALEFRSWPNHKGKWYLAYADQEDFAAVKVEGVAITHSAETLAIWAADRETRQEALTTIDHFMYQQSMDGITDLSEVPEIHEAKQLELLSTPMKDWPEDLLKEYERSITKSKDDLQEELKETLKNIAEGRRITAMSPEDRKAAIRKLMEEQ